MFDNNKEDIDALQREIDKVDFDGGLAPAGVEPAASTQDPPVTDPEAEGTPTPEPEPQPEPEPEPEPEGEADPEPTPESDDGGEEDDKPALSDSHYRAALRMGMTAEEVSELYDSSPELAAKHLAKCFEMVNSTSEQLGALGRHAAQQAQAKPEPAPQQSASGDRNPRTETDVLIDRVKSHYAGEDDPMADVMLRLLERDRQPVQQKPVQQQPEVPVRTVDEEVAARIQINTFFAADDMGVYADLYGAEASKTGDWNHLTPGQRANRVEVCNRAQELLYGAEVAGRQMGTAEALERAHLTVSAPMAEQIVRSRIVKSAKKRERGLTLQPNSNMPPDRSGGGKLNEKQAVDEMNAKLKEVFA